MTRIEESIDIRAPIETVFLAITDPRRGPEWNPNIVDVRNFSGYPIREGSTWHQSIMIAGRLTELRCRIFRFLPPHEGLLEVTGGQHGTIRTVCAEVEGRTRVTQSIDFVAPGGFMGKVLAGAATPLMQRELARTLARQRDALESDPVQQ